MITTILFSKMNLIAIKKVILFSSLTLGSIIAPFVAFTPDKKEAPFQALKESGYTIKSSIDISKLLDDGDQIIRFVATDKKGETVTGVIVNSQIRLDNL